MRLYLDTCAIQRPLDDLSQLRVRLEAEAVQGLISLCEGGQLTLVASAIHTIENDRNPYPERRAHAESVLALAPLRAAIPNEARLRAEDYTVAGVGELDSLHVAAAVSFGCEWFVTTDDRLLSRVKTLDTGSTVVGLPLEIISRLP